MIAGLDEAGRGPVLGPLVVAGILIEEEDLKWLKKIGVKDSKQLTKKKREVIFDEIASSFKYQTVIITPSEIDSARNSGISLNSLELSAFCNIINYLTPEIAYIDCFGANTKKIEEYILGNLRIRCRLVVEHGADANHTVVGAASIIAKVLRDRELEALREEYGDFGSGYPSDPKTVNFLEKILAKDGELPDFVRTSWATLKRLKRKLSLELKME